MARPKVIDMQGRRPGGRSSRGQHLRTLEVHLDADEVRMLRLTFQLMAEHARDLKPVLELIADRIWARNESTFATQGASIGHPWARNTPKWAAYKQRNGFGSAVGVYKGRLLRSLTRKSRGSRRRVTRKSLLVGSSLGSGHLLAGGRRMATDQQILTGKRSNKGRGPNMGVRTQPARQVVDISRGERNHWVLMVTDYVMGRAGLAAAGPAAQEHSLPAVVGL